MPIEQHSFDKKWRASWHYTNLHGENAHSSLCSPYNSHMKLLQYHNTRQQEPRYPRDNRAMPLQSVRIEVYSGIARFLCNSTAFSV